MCLGSFADLVCPLRSEACSFSLALFAWDVNAVDLTVALCHPLLKATEARGWLEKKKKKKKKKNSANPFSIRLVSLTQDPNYETPPDAAPTTAQIPTATPSPSQARSTGPTATPIVEEPQESESSAPRTTSSSNANPTAASSTPAAPRQPPQTLLQFASANKVSFAHKSIPFVLS